MDENNELSETERAHLQQYHSEALARHDARKDENFEPKGSAPQHSPEQPDNAHAERAALQRVLADPSRTAILDAGFRNREEAITRLDELSRAASGEAGQVEKQTAADNDFAPKSVGDYTGLDVTPQRSHMVTDETREDLQELKGELFKHGVSPDAARAIWQTGPEYYRISDADHYSKCESAVKLVKAQPNGAQTISDANRFVQSLTSPAMHHAALMAMMTPLGLKELGRLGRNLSRKGAR